MAKDKQPITITKVIHSRKPKERQLTIAKHKANHHLTTTNAKHKANDNCKLRKAKAERNAKHKDEYVVK